MLRHSNYNNSIISIEDTFLGDTLYRVYIFCVNATSEFPKKSTLQFLSIKDFRPLGIEIELLIVILLLLYCTCKITTY